MTISTRHPTIEINRYRSADYPDRVDAALAKIESTPSGNHLLEGLKPLAAHGKRSCSMSRLPGILLQAQVRCLPINKEENTESVNRKVRLL
ncbi:M91 family zinc metallopeptidase [Xanthomonas campestris]|uniref:M91 family zinc metallopeptidase n=1 Tax=Xanthomonas campestris TaxID=339 RepID=UPI0027AA0CB9|nr:hypothetical protein JH293_04000 [Xanthomonas campestris pv. campestris]